MDKHGRNILVGLINFKEAEAIFFIVLTLLLMSALFWIKNNEPFCLEDAFNLALKNSDTKFDAFSTSNDLLFSL